MSRPTDTGDSTKGDATRGDSARAEKRTAILDAALALFAERGYHATNVPLIAGQAGVSVGTLYHYFDSKEAVVNELYRRLKKDMGRAVWGGAYPKEAPVPEQFRYYWHAATAWATAHPQAFAFLEMHHHAPYLDAESKALMDDSLKQEAWLFDQGRQAGQFKPLPDAVLGAFIGGALTAMVKATWQGRLELTPEIIDAAATGCWEAIRRIRPKLRLRKEEKKVNRLSLTGEQGHLRLTLEQSTCRDGACRAAVDLRNWGYQAVGKVWISVDGLNKFYGDLRQCYDTLTGTAEFASDGGNLAFAVVFDRRGGVKVQGAYRETPDIGNELRFCIQTDQSFIGTALEEWAESAAKAQ